MVTKGRWPHRVSPRAWCRYLRLAVPWHIHRVTVKLEWESAIDPMIEVWLTKPSRTRRRLFPVLNLPDVTLVVAETRCHELIRLAITDIVLKIKFGGIVIHTDKPELIGIPAPATYVRVPDWPNKIAQGSFYYMDAAVAAKTSHALLMEWDAGLRDVMCWTDEFLKYDYIGAPWVWARGTRHTVGNGGFVLLSKRMADHVHANRNTFRIKTDVDYSQVRRIQLEREIGAKWAPQELAYQFSYEHGFERHRSESKPSFGYHDIFNWPLAMSREEVIRRTRLVLANPYIVRSTPKLRLLAEWWPWVRTEIGAMEYDSAARHQFGPIPGAPDRRPRIHLSPVPPQVRRGSAMRRPGGIKA